MITLMVEGRHEYASEGGYKTWSRESCKSLKLEHKPFFFKLALPCAREEYNSDNNSNNILYVRGKLPPVKTFKNF